VKNNAHWSQPAAALAAGWLVIGMFVAPSALAGPLAPVELEPRPLLDKSRAIEPDWRHRTDMVLVKFRDDLPIRADHDEQLDLSTLGGANPLASGSGVAESVRALIEAGRWRVAHDLPPERLLAMRLRAQENLGRAVADPRSEFYFTLPAGVGVAEAIAALNTLDVVELAMPMQIPTPSPRASALSVEMTLPPPNYQGAQGYLTTAPNGIGALLAWTLLGVRGAGVRIADIEYDFNSSHEDLPPVTVLTVGTPTPPFDNNHGTAVMGELAALNNGWGTTGIAHEADLHFSHSSVNGINNIATAIYRCVDAFEAGDVILLEAQVWGPNSVNFPPDCFGCVPVEWVFSNYNAIAIAVGNGIHVVEAAANGQQNLDDAVYSQGNGGHHPFSPGHDSGAILVGAGHAPSTYGGNGVARSRMWYSNYGSRVNVQGWGQAVWTTGYGDAYSLMGQNLYYTSGFSGTSSASPIVTGAVALVSSYHQAQLGKPMGTATLRSLLIETGTPQANGQYPLSHHIGPLPDAYAAILAIPLPPKCSADINGDGVVDAEDLSILLATIGTPNGPDLTGDGVCDADDLSMLLAGFGQDC
jgi:subtilisin family serine protease